MQWVVVAVSIVATVAVVAWFFFPRNRPDAPSASASSRHDDAHPPTTSPAGPGAEDQHVVRSGETGPADPEV